MRYAQFFIESATDKNKIIEACGSDAILPLDGRWRVSRCLEEAILHAKKRPEKNYVACQIRLGSKYSNSTASTNILKLDEIIL